VAARSIAFVPPSRLILPSLLLVVASLVAAGCNDDGRTLRPARPDQTESVSTTVMPTVAETGGLDLTLPPTLPPTIAPTIAPTMPPTAAPTSAAAGFTVTAPWADEFAIDSRYTCDGPDVPPALSWDAAPAGTQEIAVAMTDLDLPGFVHWVMAGIDPMSTGLGEGEVPEFASVGVNGMGRTAYSGPCPPVGETHRYQVTVYLLAQRTELGDGAAGADLLAAVQGSAFMTAQVTGVYSRL
jgi:Raf kinase inhibitor-like YbhB/YbcL family protein